MILVFGGTTEGRKAVDVLEESGKPYYYSTQGTGQDVHLVNGSRLSGVMNHEKIMQFCHDHDIRVLIDAAHPFAEELHKNLVIAAADLGIPVIRYDRIYSRRREDIVWCEDYEDAVRQLEKHQVNRLLALTGVKTLTKLRSYWQQHECWWRILNRQASLTTARETGFPEDHLVFYEEGHTDVLLQSIHPQAILTKESGESGGYEEKVTSALRQGVKVFVVKRPLYPPAIPHPQEVVVAYANGPHGLRRCIEKLLPGYYTLRSGLTTGTCATAAAKAAALRLMRGVTSPVVAVTLPNGEAIDVEVSYGEGYASVVKDGGDDPDVTHGIEIRAEVSQSDHFEIIGGKGVGTITLPGFDYPPGSAAINKAPREMIRNNLLPLSPTLRVVISAVGGEEIARRTFNPRLGIEGGISIIGVSGIVKPFSEEGFIHSIKKCLEVAKASGAERVVINSGAKSERFVKSVYPHLPPQAFVEYGNYIGKTIEMASTLDIRKLTLGLMLGKAVKLAAGHLDTHSRRTTMDKDFIHQMLDEAGCNLDISTITLAREIWEKLPAQHIEPFAHVVCQHCMAHCHPLLPEGELTILLIDEQGNIYS